MIKNTFCRREKKFLISNEDVEKILPVITENMETDAYNIGGKPYEISNIYFDTPGNEIIRNSLSHPYYKEKLRLRSYGPPESMDTNVFLELKKKVDGVVFKRRAVLRYGDALDYIENGREPPTGKYIDTQVMREIDAFRRMYDVRPSVYISYMRRAYFDKNDPEIRLTFDTDIVTRRNNLDIAVRGGESLLDELTILMEVKIKDAFPLYMARLFADNGLYMQTFSKYGGEYRNYIDRSRPHGGVPRITAEEEAETIFGGNENEYAV